MESCPGKENEVYFSSIGSEGLEVFQQDAVQLLARRALDICRRAAEMAEAAGKERIGLSHVTAAYQEMFTSPKIQAIRSE